MSIKRNLLSAVALCFAICVVWISMSAVWRPTAFDSTMTTLSLSNSKQTNVNVFIWPAVVPGGDESYIVLEPWLPTPLRRMIGEGQARRFDVIRGIGIKASPAGVIGKLDVIRSLRQIEVVDSTLSHDDIECLKQCHALVELCLAGTGITDEACALLALRKKIQVLSLSRENGITTSGINSFNMASLQQLSLLDCHNVVEPIDEILRAAPQLSGLELAGSQFSDRRQFQGRKALAG